MRLKKLFRWVIFLFCFVNFSANGIEEWEAPISFLSIVGQEIHDDPITPLFLVSDRQETRIVFDLESISEAETILESGDGLIKSYGYDSLFRTLGIDSDGNESYITSYESEKVVILIDYVHGECVPCKLRQRYLEEISKSYPAFSIKVSPENSELVRVKTNRNKK